MSEAEKEPKDYSVFLSRYCKESISDLAEEYPDSKTLLIDFENLDKFNP